MTIEPTTDPPAPEGESTDDAPTVRTGEASAPKVTRARVKTSGAAPGGRAKGPPKAGSPTRAAQKAGAATAPVLAPASKLVPVPMATSETGTARPDRVEITHGGADRVEATTVSITQGGTDSVEATTVSISQGGIGTADAHAIDIHQGGIGRASATDIAVSVGAIGFAQGERVSVEMGAIGGAFGGEVRVTQSIANYVLSRGDATMDQSFVNTLIADRVTIRQPSAVILLIARHVDGSVRPLLDWRGALAAGAVAGLVMGLLRLGRR
jgi:hypothetical protein